MKRILELGPGECRWPMACPDKEHLFCAESTGGSAQTYCATHRKLAYRPAPAARPQVEPDVHPFAGRSLSYGDADRLLLEGAA